MEDNIIVFLGRFHPLVVHLPIGFLLMAGLLQLFAAKKKTVNFNPAIAFTLFWEHWPLSARLQLVGYSHYKVVMIPKHFFGINGWGF